MQKTKGTVNYLHAQVWCRWAELVGFTKFVGARETDWEITSNEMPYTLKIKGPQNAGAADIPGVFAVWANDRGIEYVVRESRPAKTTND